MIKNIVIIRCENQNEKEHYYIPKIDLWHYGLRNQN